MLQTALFNWTRTMPILRIAQEFGEEGYVPAWGNNVHLGEDEYGSHYFAKIAGNELDGVVSGELIPDDEIHEKTIAYWESYFDEMPSEIAGMMDNGYMGDVKERMIEEWVDAEDYSESTVYYSSEIDEEHEDRDDLVQGIRDWYEGDFENPEEYEAAVKSAVDDIEEKEKYYSEVLNDTFDSEEELKERFRDMYEAEFKTYAGEDLSRYSREAAEAVVEADGDGHGLDVSELDDGNWISLNSWSSADIMDSEHVPGHVKKNLAALLHGGRPQQVYEPLEGGEPS